MAGKAIRYRRISNWPPSRCLVRFPINMVRAMNDFPLLPVEPKSLREASRPDFPKLMQALRARTPARILVGRAGPAYRTTTQLELRQDHAAAVDAVHAELDPAADFGHELVA